MAENVGQIQKVRNHPVNSGRIGKPVCPDCGFRIRGKLADHMRGDHHKNKLRRWKDK
jgi:hypothetical protein